MSFKLAARLAKQVFNAHNANFQAFLLRIETNNTFKTHVFVFIMQKISIQESEGMSCS